MQSYQILPQAKVRAGCAVRLEADTVWGMEGLLSALWPLHSSLLDCTYSFIHSENIYGDEPVYHDKYRARPRASINASWRRTFLSLTCNEIIAQLKISTPQSVLLHLTDSHPGKSVLEELALFGRSGKGLLRKEHTQAKNQPPIVF